MGKTVKRLIILGGIFLVAAIAFIWLSWGEERQTEVVYDVIEDATLPVVTLEAEGVAVNTLYGYLGDMQASYLQESLTPLTEDRKLPLTIDTYGNQILGIRYEIRSLNGEDLVEEIAIEQWETQDTQVLAFLPIQDIIREGTEYGLKLTLTTDRHAAVDYYTRVMRDSSLHTREMLEYVTDFHSSTFQPAEAEKYAINWEVDNTADKETLANVDIHSDFSQLTYSGLSPIPVGKPQITILELDDTFGSFRIRFELQAESEDTRMNNYIAEEFICLQWSEIRFYLMGYERTMRQIFDASIDTFTEETIEFGVVQESDISVLQSPGGDYRVFTVGGDLWSYSPDRREAVLLFSFQQEDDAGPRRLHEEYDVQVVNVDDDGNAEFFVYGYMNRGSHEGQVGLSYYRYIKEDNALQEIFYVPSDKSYQVLKAGIDTLSHREGNLVYLLFDNNVYAVDYQGQEVVVVVEDADAHGLVVNEEQTAIAWKQGADLQQAEAVQILYLDTGETQLLTAGSGEYMRTQGFIGTDFIGTTGRSSDVQADGFETVYPQYKLSITNREGGVEATYQFDSIYITGVEVGAGQVHLQRIQKNGDVFVRLEDDTLMQNTTELPDIDNVLSSRVGEKRLRVQYLKVETDSGRKTLNVSVPNRVLYNTDTTLQSAEEEPLLRYYAYGAGKLLGIYDNAGDAILVAYDAIGWVTDSLGNRVWHRTARSTDTVQIPVSEDARVTGAAERMAGCLRAILLLEGIGEDVSARLEAGQSAQAVLDELLPGSTVNLSGCDMKQIYYYLAQETPVLVISTDETPLLLVGYDPYNVDVYDPLRGETYKMGQQDAADTFAAADNRFLSYIR